MNVFNYILHYISSKHKDILSKDEKMPVSPKTAWNSRSLLRKVAGTPKVLISDHHDHLPVFVSNKWTHIEKLVEKAKLKHDFSTFNGDAFMAKTEKTSVTWLSTKTVHQQV